MTIHDDRNRNRELNRLERERSSGPLWAMGALAALVVLGLIFWSMSDRGTTTATNTNQPTASSPATTGSTTATRPAAPAPTTNPPASANPPASSNPPASR